MGAGLYPRSKRYKALREKHVFKSLDAAVSAMDKLKFTNPYDGRVLGALATVMFQNDPKAIGYLRNRKVKALDSKDDRKELWELVGLMIAEDFLKARKDQIPLETRLTSAKSLLSSIDALFEAMAAAGAAMAQVDVLANEMSVRFADLEDPSNIALALINDAIGTYESLVPRTKDDEVPNPVERRAIAKAAFLRLAVEDLEKQVAEEDFKGEYPSKDTMAEALAEKYGNRLNRVAEIVLKRLEGDPDYGLVTRLLPLREPPNLVVANRAFEALKGRYIEAKTASFFIFGDTSLRGDTLRVRGRVRSFTVNPAEAGGKAQLNFKPFKDEIVITLRSDERWAEVNARRSSDLGTVRSVLRRTGEVEPALLVPVPDKLSSAPYDTWDSRTLWMLDFLRRELRSVELNLDNTHMAHFLSPDKFGDDEDPDAERSRRPSVDAVRLLGTQLHDHPEACQRIAGRARLRDLEVRVRHVFDLAHGYNRLVRFRLSWEDDHLAILTGATDDALDPEFHRMVVKLVRHTAGRQLDEVALKFTLRQIEKRAEEGDVPENARGVLDDEDAAEAS
jgi:hypothetical protein